MDNTQNTTNQSHKRTLNLAMFTTIASSSVASNFLTLSADYQGMDRSFHAVQTGLLTGVFATLSGAVLSGVAMWITHRAMNKQKIDPRIVPTYMLCSIAACAIPAHFASEAVNCWISPPREAPAERTPPQKPSPDYLGQTKPVILIARSKAHQPA